jgi:rRNA maturation protein Nop10
MRDFGQPSETPHACKGGTNHTLRLHLCEACGTVGHTHRPSPFSKAGKWHKRQLEIINSARRKNEKEIRDKLVAERIEQDLAKGVDLANPTENS